MIQLRIRTEYSFGQTYAPIPRIIERLKAIGCTAAGIVDGSTWGHSKWVKACEKAAIQPLLGVECIVSDDLNARRMWFLAKTTEGLSELYAAMTKSHTQKLKGRFGSQPRLYRADVEAMSAQIVKFAGDLDDGAWLKSVGAFLDLNPASVLLNLKKEQLAKKYRLSLVSTSDNSYSFPEDRSVFELMSKGSLKPTPQHLLDTLANQDTATEIARSCEHLAMPKAQMLRAKGNLEALCRQGIRARHYTRDGWTQAYEDRLQLELDLINKKDFVSYFLIVADMVQYAKKHMLVGPSRGSAAGSLVCYLTRITELDPLVHGLMFERFIDETRVDLPDIDLDFPDNKRYLVLDYMAEKYGAENVAHIGTILRYKPKSALIQVCKALNIPIKASSAVKTALIERSSADARASNCLEDTFTTTKPGKDFIRDYPAALDAMKLEHHASHTGTHAAGLLVCNEPITKFCTVDAEGIAYLEKDAAEALGLLKIDILGLRTLSILEDSGVNIDWYNLPLTDQPTLDLFNTGRLCGIFQFDGNAMRSIATVLKVKSIIEIDAVTALARPGPFAGGVTKKYIDRMNGATYKPIHPKVEAYMAETYGLPVYQEQTLAIVREIGGFGWKETSTIRKAMSKSMGVEFFNQYWEQFRKGAEACGVPEKEAKSTWEMINAMGSWAMNKSHTRSYALISYWCAYLKTHHPLEFAAANLRNAKDQDNAVLLLREMTREGIEYVPFDLDKSEVNWSVKDGKLYGGFTALKGIGESKAAKLIEARNTGTLTQKQKDDLKKCFNIFADLFPLQTKYQAYYTDHAAQGLSYPLSFIADLLAPLPHGEARTFLAEMVHKNPRNANEDAEIKKRNGKIETGQLEYLDLRLRDDTGVIGGRIGRKDYLQIGVELAEKVPMGAHLLIRAKFFYGITYAFITDWKRLDVY